MKYQSTRGEAPVLEFSDVLLAGLAVDGGLYVPTEFPMLKPSDLRSFAEMSYSEVATRVLTPFVSPSISTNDLGTMIEQSYSTFRHPDVVPVKQLPDEVGNDRYLAELYWGPTFSFKDVALQLLGRLFEHELTRRDTGVTIVGATSGDTGSAAIEACKDRNGIELIMLHPRGRVSEIQRRQMTTVTSPNIHNVAIDGTFDDCQDLVKAMFSDLQFRERYNLAAVNSINWARVAAQTVYYFTSATRIAGPNEQISFCVPTGNFGNIFAGYVAKKMGLPIRRLILATNENDILARFFNSGIYERGLISFTHSPAMDIQIASNFERYLYYQCDQNTEKLTEFMLAFAETGKAVQLFNSDRFDESILAAAVSNDETIATIRRYHAQHSYLVDPHTAVGLTVAEQFKDTSVPLLSLSTAHPAKFDNVMTLALPDVAVNHPTLDALNGLPTRKTVLPVSIEAVKALIRE